MKAKVSHQYEYLSEMVASAQDHVSCTEWLSGWHGSAATQQSYGPGCLEQC